MHRNLRQSKEKQSREKRSKERQSKEKRSKERKVCLFMRKQGMFTVALFAGLAALSFTGCSSNGEKPASSNTDQKENDNDAADDTSKENNEENENQEEQSKLAPGAAEREESGEEAEPIEIQTRVSVHDPSILAADGTYYVYGSHIAAARSTDLVNWTYFANGYVEKGNSLYGNLKKNLKGSFEWAGEHDSDCKNGYAVWAPDVFWNADYVNEDGSKGAYMIYYCTSSTAIRSCIGYAVSQEIEGPFTYVDTIIYSGFSKEEAYDNDSKINKCYENTNILKLIEEGKIDGINEDWFKGETAYNNSYAPNAIDPEIFYDTEGKMWMVYGSWSGGIFVLEMNPETGEAIYPGKSEKMEDLRIVDSYFGTRIAGGYTASGEGPYIVYDKETDYYYLYVTYEFLDAFSGYNMRLFRSKTPEGPYLDSKGNNAALPGNIGHNDYGIKVMGNYTLSAFEGKTRGGYRSCGHNSALVDEDGSRYLFYHTRFELDPNPHELRVHQQFMNSQDWPVTAVFENRGDKISETGYNKDSIVGDYEYINHGIQCDREKMLEVKNITLNDDGTISGDAEGTWAEADDSYQAEFTIDGEDYYGVFFRQHDESTDAKYVMTFTAVGNNKTVWGVRK